MSFLTKVEIVEPEARTAFLFITEPSAELRAAAAALEALAEESKELV